MRYNIGLNLILITAYLLFLGLSRWLGFVFPLYFFGLLIFFLPGLNLALSLEQFSSPFGKIKTVLWSFLFSIILVPTFILALPFDKLEVAQEKETLLSFFLLIFLSLAIFLLSHLARKNPVTKIKFPAFKSHPAFWIATLIFIFSLGLHFALYIFIPEADGYGYLRATEKSIATGKLANFDSRQIFLVFSWTLFQLTKIPLFLIYKIILPLLGIFTFLVFYRISAQLFQKKWLLILSSLSPLFFPIFALDLLIPRPQLIFTLVFPVFLFLLNESKKSSLRKNYLIHFVLFCLSILGFAFHQLFFFLPIIQLLFLFQSFGISQKLTSAKAFGFYFLIALLFFLSAKIEPLANRLSSLFQIFFANFSLSNFRFWFLNDYTDVYGAKMGWPGLSFLYYYGYNIGLLFPVLLVLSVIKKIRLEIKENSVYFLSFLIFFLFAEIAPRFGLAYMPNRMWLFVSLSLAFFIPSFFKKLENKFSVRKLFIILIVSAFLSLLVNWLLTYEKQGWISLAEYRATEFIKNETEKDALFISQIGNVLAISHFGQRSMITPSNEFFLENKPDKDEIILDNLSNILSCPLKKEVESSKRIPLIMHYIYTDDPASPDFQTPSSLSPIYIFYSTEKFQGIKGNRPWWKEMNFFGADLNKFNNAERYEKVYDKEGVKIWKVKLYFIKSTNKRQDTSYKQEARN